MTINDLLTQIEDRASAATEGPLDYSDNYILKEGLDGERGYILAAFYGDNPMYGDNCNDTEFFARARQDIPKLCKALREAVDALEQVYINVEDTNTNVESFTKNKLNKIKSILEKP